jgi:hypothetical protein
MFVWAGVLPYRESEPTDLIEVKAPPVHVRVTVSPTRAI